MRCANVAVHAIGEIEFRVDQEDCTLPHLFCWKLLESSGFQCQIPECLGVTRAKLAYLFWEESGGVHWKPAYSGGVHGIHPDFFR